MSGRGRGAIRFLPRVIFQSPTLRALQGVPTRQVAGPPYTALLSEILLLQLGFFRDSRRKAE